MSHTGIHLVELFSRMPRTFVATVVFVTAMTTLVVCNIRLGIGIKFMNPVVRSVWFEPLVTADKPQ